MKMAVKKIRRLAFTAAFLFLSFSALAFAGSAVQPMGPPKSFKPSPLSQAVLLLKKAQIEIEQAKKDPLSPKTLNYSKILNELSRIITTLETTESQ